MQYGYNSQMAQRAGGGMGRAGNLSHSGWGRNRPQFGRRPQGMPTQAEPQGPNTMPPGAGGATPAAQPPMDPAMMQRKQALFQQQAQNAMANGMPIQEIARMAGQMFRGETGPPAQMQPQAQGQTCPTCGRPM